MVNRIYPPELQLNKANTSDTEAPFLDLHLFISNRFVSSKIYDKRDDFDFDIVNFPFLDGGVPRSISYEVYISQLIRFARVSSHVEGSHYIACNERQAFFTCGDIKRYKLWSCQNMSRALIYLLDNIYIRFGTKLYRQIVGIPMGTNCVPLVADLFFIFYLFFFFFFFATKEIS